MGIKKSMEDSAKDMKDLEAAAKTKSSASGVFTKTPKKAEKQTWIYCGPTIKNVISSGDLFRGEKLPEWLDKLRQEDLELKRLLIPVEQLAEAKKRLRQNGSVENQAYKSLRTRRVKGEKSE